MQQQQHNYANPQSTEEEELDLAQLLKSYLAYWPIYLGAVVLLLGLAWLYTQVVRPHYPVQASVIFLDQQDAGNTGGAMATMGSLNISELASGIQNVNVDNEMLLMKSREMVQMAIEESGAYIDLSSRKGLRTITWYGNLPFALSMTSYDLQQVTAPFELEIKLLGGTSYEVYIPETSTLVQVDSLPTTFATPYGIMAMRPQEVAPENQTELPSELTATIHSPLGMAIQLSEKGTLNLERAEKQSSVAVLRIQSDNKAKGEAFLGKLIEVYNRERAIDKNAVAQKTYSFINERIAIIGEELGNTEEQLEQVKRSQGVTSYQDLGVVVTSSAQTEKLRAEAETQVRLVEYLLEYLRQPSNQYHLIPGAMGLSDAPLQAAVNAYNSQIFERNTLLETASEQHPRLLAMNANLDKARVNIRDAAELTLQGLEIKLNDIKEEEQRLGQRIAQAPTYERISTDIERQRAIRSDLYLMLLTKREETSIQLAASLESARLVDSPLAAATPATPKKPVVYLAGFILALLLPTAFIFLWRLTRTKLRNEEELRSLTHLPLLGAIPELDEKEREGNEIVVQTHGNSLMTEVFRSLRTNVAFATANKRPVVIMVTSTQPGEGKSLVAANLAVSLSALEGRVLLVGLDIRNPQLRRVFKLNTTTSAQYGMVDLLNDPQLNPLHYIQHSEQYPSLSLIHAGSTPPNPPELLARPRLEEIFALFTEHYDYIVVDAAPVGPVVDSIVLSRIADVTLYVVRSGKTDKRDLDYIHYLAQEEKLPNINLLLNGVAPSTGKFAKRYGYGYGNMREAKK